MEQDKNKVLIDQGDSVFDKSRRNMYLSSKGIRPSDAFQLSLAFPEIIGDRSDMRHIPNDYARSSLFTTRNKRVPRQAFTHKKLFHYNNEIEMLFTGVELRADDDEVIWLQILDFGRATPLGEIFEVSLSELISKAGWAINGRNHTRAIECISRLSAAEVLAKNDKAYGSSGPIRLVRDYRSSNGSRPGKATRFLVQLDPGLRLLFAGNTFTSHYWEKYRKLSPVARRLADYLESHKNPFALSVSRFKDLCSSLDKNDRSWRQTVRRACVEVEESGLSFSLSVREDKIFCCRV
ncbi:MAG: TrfA family protein [Polynucleobacter sp. 39-45-136]|jgi:hypothetical protein|nr:MAG: TrfA family protein [Polynucleobacter sp. 39-45-136]